MDPGEPDLRPVFGWRVDMPGRQSPEPIGMLLFQISPDFVQKAGERVSRDRFRRRG
jgi:hypothetical protein